MLRDVVLHGLSNKLLGALEFVSITPVPDFSVVVVLLKLRQHLAEGHLFKSIGLLQSCVRICS